MTNEKHCDERYSLHPFLIGKLSRMDSLPLDTVSPPDTLSKHDVFSLLKRPG